MPGLGGTINRLPHFKMSWHNLQFLLQSSWMPNNRDFLADRALIVHSRKSPKQETEKVSDPLQRHSVTEYLLSRTCSDRTHRDHDFFV